MAPTDYKTLLAITATVLLVAIASSFVMAQERDDGHFLSGRIVAIGIPGISAVSPVGTFLPGGPFTISQCSPRSLSQGEFSTRRGSSSPAPRTLARR